MGSLKQIEEINENLPESMFSVPSVVTGEGETVASVDKDVPLELGSWRCDVSLLSSVTSTLFSSSLSQPRADRTCGFGLTSVPVPRTTDSKFSCGHVSLNQAWPGPLPGALFISVP